MIILLFFQLLKTKKKNDFNKKSNQYPLQALLQERHGNDRFYVFKTLCRFKSRVIDEKNNKFICIIPSKKEYHLLDELNKNCFIKVIIKALNKRTIKSQIR